MIKLDLSDLYVSSYAIGSGDDAVGPGADTTIDTGTETDLKNTDPRACPYSQGWNCFTNADGCESGGGAGC
jgi:hypothetical protein